MADWKQITARIRRARTSKDPAGQLSNLFQKTRDAMVAFELARYFEGAGSSGDAAKWYATAAERFRRADWKAKAQEAVARLGGALEAPPAGEVSEPNEPSSEAASVDGAEPETITEPQVPHDEPIAEAPESATSTVNERDTAAASAASGVLQREGSRRRRGRRGGRNRRKPGAERTSAPTAPSAAEPAAPREGLPPSKFAPATEPASPRIATSRAPMPPLPVEPAVEAITTGGAGPKGRYGDPGLSSRISLLEMQFRRLLTCPPVKLSEADHAPAGPGVLLLTDSDLTTYYYVEPCQTLRIAIGNLLRGGSNRRGAESIKPRFAEHLGIPETRVTKYVADHCVVRWLQLDEGASHFAHFVTAILRPVLND